MRNLSAFRQPFLNRIRNMRAVWRFSLAALVISIAVWICDPWLLELLGLQPLGGGGSNARIPISIVGYAFVHSQVYFLISSLIAILIFGVFVEPRIGTRVTKWVIISGIIIPAAFWLLFGDVSFLTGSSGVSYALIGSMIGLWHRLGRTISLGERIFIGVIVIWTLLGAIGSLFSPWTTWVTLTSIPAGYAIAFSKFPRGSRQGQAEGTS